VWERTASPEQAAIVQVNSIVAMDRCIFFIMLVFVTDAKVVKVWQCASGCVKKYVLSIFSIDDKESVDRCNTNTVFKNIVGVIYG
jgi:hypothetical protein